MGCPEGHLRMNTRPQNSTVHVSTSEGSAQRGLWLHERSRLEPANVHVWRTWLNQPREAVEQLWKILAADERQRAEKFLFEHLRTRYVVGRGALRMLLGHYLEQAPEDVVLNYGHQGKPELAEGELQFNLSHSHDLALFGFSLNRELGIDVEQVRAISDRDSIANRFFSPSEAEHLSQIPAADQDLAFFECWTRKEAYIKAIGDGLTYPLDGFRVAFGPGRRAELLAVDAQPTEVDRWNLIPIEPAPGYTAALIAERPPWSMTRFHFDPAHWALD